MWWPVVYLLHFSAPLGDLTKAHGTARHYIGFCARAERLSDRILEHERGYGAAITRAARAKGFDLIIARTWPGGDRDLEKKLKSRKKARMFCPVCQAEREGRLVRVDDML